MKKYNSIIDLLEDSDIDGDFIKSLKERIEKKEQIKKDIAIVRDWIKTNVFISQIFENIVKFIDEEFESAGGE